MKHRFTFLLLLMLYFGCTSNPFFTDEIRTNKKFSFSGNVQLPFTTNHSDITVYLEGLDVLTKTDTNGDFTIEMPLDPGLQSGQGLTGFYNVYYYVANYQIEFSSVFINKGEFAFGVANLDKEGVISEKVVLRQLLDVKTIINPEQIKQNHSDGMTITVRLENRVDSVLVFSHFTKDDKLASAFLADRDFPEENIYLLSQPSNIHSVLIDSLKFWTMDIFWPVDGSNVDVGSYDVIPYLFVYQPDIPEAMINKMGNNVTWFTRDYLKLPFRRQNAELYIEESSD